MSDDATRQLDEHFLAAIRSNDARKQLVALRDLVAEELTGNRCKACQMLQIRSGEIAALAARLQKIIEDLAQIPVGDGEAKPKVAASELTGLQLIQGRRGTGTDDTRVQHGTKSAPRRQGGRRTSGK